MCQLKNIETIDCRDIITKKAEIIYLSIINPSFAISNFFKNKLNSKNFKESEAIKKNNPINIKNNLSPKNSYLLNLKPGDIVRILSKEEIDNMLDENNKLHGCYFMDEMYKYCGTRQKILKKIDYFFDEYNQIMRRASSTYLLKDLYCTSFELYKHKCDRNCLFFWRDEWLEKVL